MNEENIKEKLKKIITIDGQGRANKALFLLELINDFDIEDIKKVLQELLTLKY